jgi:hypothetical protein
MANQSGTVEQGTPLTISVETAGALLGMGRQSAYSAMWRGELPTIEFGGRRKYVPVARLAALVGREITANDIDRANAAVRARKQTRPMP